jgi:CRISPR-associated endonuclease/helicase Cas3
MNRDETKAQRLLQIEKLLWAHPEGLTRAEIARRMNLNRSTITKYLDKDQLPKSIYEDDLDGNKLKVDRSADLTKASFSLHEVLAIHLATRLLATRTDKPNRHAASALRKLGLALQRLDKNVSGHLLRSADVMDEDANFCDPVYLKVLETLTEAWSAGRKVHLHHQMEDGRIFEYDFAPYFIEPYAVGQTAHVIGWREPPAAIRTFKIERIRAAQITRDAYTIPADFDPAALLRDAWGIWYTDGEPTEVVLRFHPRVALRVKETRWHASQQIAEQADGYLLWRARVAEVQEMIPWVRGWGADVEVVGPEALRQALRREARRLAEMYGVMEMSPTQPQYYAHSRPDEDESGWQPLEDHLVATGELAAKLGRAAGISELARIAGNLHDIGKYSAEFQARLRGSRTRVDHATAGAREVVQLFADPPHRDWAELISYCIAGHHTGLPDYGSKADVESDGTLLARRDKKPLKDFSAYKTEITLPFWQPRPGIKSSRFRFGGKEMRYTGFSISFLTRMLFSALVDADWLETERYMDDAEKPRGQYASIDALAAQFDDHLKRFADPQTPINRKRTEILNACCNGASAPPGFFTLTVPTGGGKTLASMAFALDHARTHGLERVIYVIPFTSIIEQNAAVFRDALGALGKENVLEHHSNYDWEVKNRVADDETNQVTAKLKLAAENWDIPIVVTTNVQFFESLFASKKSQARKLHNIAKSVLVFDEAQMLPRHYLKPCLLAVQELVQNYGCSAVLCTATQPSLQQFFPEQVKFTELAPDPQVLFDFFRRVQVTNLETVPDAELIEKLHAQQQALCIVNTRRHAKGLYDLLDQNGAFHLSTLMCPAHRRKTLDEIRRRLKAGETCRVISTQVMEAGIDVDFPVGYRALAGLDSIIQAAGRVNREMRSASGDVFVFRPQTEFIKRTPEFVKQTGSVAEVVLRDHAGDATTTEAIEAYYTLLYTLHDEQSFDTQEITRYFEKGTGRPDFDFQTAAEKFKLIDESSVTVFIPYDDDARCKIEALKYTLYPASTLRQLQPYAVNIFEYEFENLQSKGVIQTIADTFHVLDPNEMAAYYNPATGLVIPERSSGAAIFID